jgi:hypothetical protein
MDAVLPDPRSGAQPARRAQYGTATSPNLATSRRADGLGLDRMRRAPGIVAARERDGVEAALPQVPRHTGARGFVGSGTVRHRGTGAIRCGGPRPDLVRQHAHTARNLTGVRVVLRPPAHIQHHRRLRAGKAPR